MQNGDLRIILMSEKPELRHQTYSSVKDCWGEFLFHPTVALKHKEYLAANLSDFQFFVVDSNENILAFCKSIPTYWDGVDESLPDGYDAGLEWAVEIAKTRSKKCNTLQALSINVFKNNRGLGLGSFCIEAMKSICRKNDLNNLIAPVRPGSKIKFPEMDLKEYADMKNPDGTLYDSWLKTFQKYGGRKVTPIVKGMMVSGTIADWEQWTKRKFSISGKYIVEEALAPVEIDLEENIGVYWDPCVWFVVPIK